MGCCKKTYLDSENNSELFELDTTLRELKQGFMDVTHYYNKLTCFLQQFDMIEEIKWDCPTHSVRYMKIVEKQRIFAFLAGLNKILNEVRGRILAIKPLPSVREAFSEVQREESRRKVYYKSIKFCTLL